MIFTVNLFGIGLTTRIHTRITSETLPTRINTRINSERTLPTRINSERTVPTRINSERTLPTRINSERTLRCLRGLTPNGRCLWGSSCTAFCTYGGPLAPHFAPMGVLLHRILHTVPVHMIFTVNFFCLGLTTRIHTRINSERTRILHQVYRFPGTLPRTLHCTVHRTFASRLF